MFALIIYIKFYRSSILSNEEPELLLESSEDLQKLPAEVSQFTMELHERDWQVRKGNVNKENQQFYEGIFKTMRDMCDDLIETNNKLNKKINYTDKVNKILTFTSIFLVGLLLALVITSIISKT